MACSLQNIITMQRGKHTRLTLETMRVCRLAPAAAGEHLHTLANTFCDIQKVSRMGLGLISKSLQ